ncbi:hypothetical protein E4U61_004181, partial [Claviceps capensis]
MWASSPIRPGSPPRKPLVPLTSIDIVTDINLRKGQPAVSVDPHSLESLFSAEYSPAADLALRFLRFRPPPYKSGAHGPSTMLDTFEIITTSGVVLWSKSYTPLRSSIVNNFIADTFIEEKHGGSASRDGQSAATNPAYRTDQHTLKWTVVKELGIIFVAVYRSLLHLSWVDKLVDNIRTIFVKLYGEQLTKPHTTIVECAGFDDYFEQQMEELDASSSTAPPAVTDAGQSASVNQVPAAPGLSHRGRHINGLQDDERASHDFSPVATPIISRSSTPVTSNLLVAKAGPVAKMSRRARKAKNQPSSAPASSGDESSKASGSKKGTSKKVARTWNDDGTAGEADPDLRLDYSAQANAGSDSDVETRGRSSALDVVDSSTWGNTTKGKFVLKDLGDEVQSLLASAKAEEAAAVTAKSGVKTGLLGSGVNALSGLFRNVVGGKTLTQEDLDKAMKGMEEHLLRKNVAREAALRLCEGVEKELLGAKTASFEGINTKIQSAMESSLTKMLTPTSSLDLLREIDSITTPPATSLRKPRPYVISIVGVNGVGKSTNLSKICFFLLQNRYKVLIAAGDTFRSGAVEQLAVHVRNLKELTAREGGQIELYQKGYGKDAATVAKDAVAHAAQQAFDVVLIDTAGRRHNDQRLMSSLEKFAKFAQPDKILMVGE